MKTHLISPALKVMALLLLLLISPVSGCVTYQACQEKFGTSQEKPRVDADLDTQLPGDSSKVGFNQEQLRKMPVGSTISSPSAGAGSAQASGLANPVKTSLTRTGANSWDCSGKTETKPVQIKVPCDCPPVNNFAPKPEIIKVTVTPWWNSLLIGFLAIGFVLQSIRLWLKGRVKVYALPDYLNMPPPPARPILAPSALNPSPAPPEPPVAPVPPAGRTQSF